MKATSSKKLEAARTKIALETEAYIAQGGEVAEIVYDEEGIKANLKSKYSKLTNKTNTFRR